MRQDRRRGLSASQKRSSGSDGGAGSRLNDIARALAKHRGSIHYVLSSSGGIEPPPRRRSRLALSLSEREEISRGLAEGQSMREIASSIQRAPSTVSREIGRHRGRERYRAAEADQRAWDHARRPKPCRLAVRRRLQKLVAKKLSLNWSPEQIAGWLKRRYPGDPGDADLPRNHLPKPLRSGARRAQEGARRASENAANDPAVQEEPHFAARAAVRSSMPSRSASALPRSRTVRSPATGRGISSRVRTTRTSRRWSSASLGSRCW